MVATTIFLYLLIFDNNLGIIIGPVVGGAALCALFIVLAAILVARRMKKKRKVLRVPDFTKLMFSTS